MLFCFILLPPNPSPQKPEPRHFTDMFFWYDVLNERTGDPVKEGGKSDKGQCFTESFKKHKKPGQLIGCVGFFSPHFVKLWIPWNIWFGWKSGPGVYMQTPFCLLLVQIHPVGISTHTFSSNQSLERYNICESRWSDLGIELILLLIKTWSSLWALDRRGRKRNLSCWNKDSCAKIKSIPPNIWAP